MTAKTRLLTARQLRATRHGQGGPCDEHIKKLVEIMTTPEVLKYILERSHEIDQQYPMPIRQREELFAAVRQGHAGLAQLSESVVDELIWLGMASKTTKALRDKIRDAYSL